MGRSPSQPKKPVTMKPVFSPPPHERLVVKFRLQKRNEQFYHLWPNMPMTLQRPQDPVTGFMGKEGREGRKEEKGRGKGGRCET